MSYDPIDLLRTSVTSFFASFDTPIHDLDKRIRSLHQEIDTLTEERRELWKKREQYVDNVTQMLGYDNEE